MKSIINQSANDQSFPNPSAPNIGGSAPPPKGGGGGGGLRLINLIVVHCSATPEGRDYTVKDIDRWHKERGWKGIGYHWVVYRDGSIHKGRPEAEVGAHAAPYNSHSIGICYIGGQRPTPDPSLIGRGEVTAKAAKTAMTAKTAKAAMTAKAEKAAMTEKAEKTEKAAKAAKTVKYVSADTRTPEQKVAMRKLIKELLERYPGSEVLGHCNLPGVKKSCPCFDARREYKDLTPA